MEVRKKMLTEFSRFWTEARDKLTTRGAAMPFESVGASVRTMNIFTRQLHTETVGDLLRMSPAEVVKVWGIGPLALKDLQESIGAFLDSDLNQERETDPEIRLQDRIASVFKAYIADNPYFDVVRSAKVGYLFINTQADGDFIDATHCPTAEELCSRLYSQIAYDVLFSIPDRPENLHLMTDEQKHIVRSKLAKYSDQLPEYEYLIDNLFLPPEWKINAIYED